MYFLKTKQLAAELKARTLPAKERVKYYLAWALLTILSSFSLRRAPEGLSGWLDLVAEACYLAAFIAVCYGSNAAGDGQDFVQRLLCISWPETVKLSGAGLLLALVSLHGGHEWAPLMDRRITNLVGWTVILFFSWRVLRYIKRISGDCDAA